MPGLGEDWEKILQTLSRISNYYRRLNTAVSFGLDSRLRRELVGGKIGEGDIVLDAGAGEGSLTEVILEEKPGLTLMLDPLLEMLNKSRLINVEKVVGVFESLPLRSASLDIAALSFSLRDSRDMEQALSELSRTLKDDGKLLVLDLGKPDNLLTHLFFKLYWRIIAPLIAFIMLGVKGIIISEIYRTYSKLPKNAELIKLVKRFFKKVEWRERLMGGVLMVNAWKPRQAP